MLDPEASGFGIYGVFWFGAKRRRPIPTPPNNLTQPETADEMENLLRTILPEEKRVKIADMVFDVNEPFRER
jgi:hypothetical protein